MSYTTFSYSPVTVIKRETNTKANEAEAAWVASVMVTNTGDREGTETVQLYIRDVSGSVVRPVREIKRL